MTIKRIILVLSIPVAFFLFRGAGYLIYNLPVATFQGFDATFESADLSEWNSAGAKQLCCSHSAEVVEKEASGDGYAVKVTLTRDDPNVKDSKRAEFRLKASRMRENYWYAFSALVPEDWKSDSIPVILAQWHGVPDKLLGETYRFPPLSLEILEDEFRIQSVSDHARITKAPVLGYRSDTANRSTLWSGPLETGKWIYWQFHVRWSYKHDGFTRVWKDGVLIVQSDGPTTYNDFIGPYLKLGVYVPKWKRTDLKSKTSVRSVMFDEIHVRKNERP